MFEIIKNTNIDFMGLKKYAFAFSGVVVLFGLYAVFQIYAGRANLGIDLAGGTSIQVRFEQPVAIDQVRKTLEAGGFPEASLQAVPGENIILVKVSARGKEEKMVGEKVIGLLRKGFPPHPPVDIPDERARVQLDRVQLAREPPLAPRAELADDRRELQTSGRQSVLGSAVAVVALDRSSVGQLAKACREHGARDARDPALDLPEPAASAQQLAHDEERPPLPEQIEGARHRAELPVALHAPTITRSPPWRSTDFVPK